MVRSSFHSVSSFHLIAVLARVQCANGDRKSTRLNSSHGYISYAVFCLKKKKVAIAHSVIITLLCLPPSYLTAPSVRSYSHLNTCSTSRLSSLLSPRLLSPRPHLILLVY